MSQLETIMPRGEKSVPAKGNNSDQLLKNYVERVGNIMNEMSALNSDLKDVLRQAKSDGFLKTAIRKTVKQLQMTGDHLDAKREIDEATKHYVAICKELPLFKFAEGNA